MNWDYEQLSKVAAMLKIFWKFIDSNKGLQDEISMQMWLVLLKRELKASISTHKDLAYSNSSTLLIIQLTLETEPWYQWDQWA